MAYMNVEKKNKLAPGIKKVLAEYGMKGTLAKEFLLKLKDAMMVGNHNNTDLMTDYFDVGWYIKINVGKWDKPYEVTG